ncbi:histone-lysine N-methyltransferase SETMAR [Elysia marginata]|uniref:Histone-lysine N-methyltransferase SETMAR n=1 Tax=Elysia marginata TaxID=1093978 RepID=A0AAV4EBH2_9GAST|nr:histone-lysine N-methyltransferase SETMAR [Elysia marginata]
MWGQTGELDQRSHTPDSYTFQTAEKRVFVVKIVRVRPEITTTRQLRKEFVSRGQSEHHNQCTVLQEGAARQTQTCQSKKRPGLLESGILFHHDNAPVHTARAVTDVLAGYKWELLEHPRYSPDLAPCNFHLLPKMKEHLRGQRFETEEDIIQATKVAIKNLDKCSYVTAFKDWLQRIEKCANNGGCE